MFISIHTWVTISLRVILFSCFSSAVSQGACTIVALVVQSHPLFSLVLLPPGSSNCCGRFHAFPFFALLWTKKSRCFSHQWFEFKPNVCTTDWPVRWNVRVKLFKLHGRIPLFTLFLYEYNGWKRLDSVTDKQFKLQKYQWWEGNIIYK